MDDVSRRIDEIEQWRKRGKYSLALLLCDDLLLEHPDSCDALWQRAFLRRLTSNIEGAINDLTQILAVRPEEPRYLVERAHFLIDGGQYQNAVDDLTEVLRLCDMKCDHSYGAIAHFVRAYAYLRLARPVSALEDCHHVQTDFRWWIEFGLRTRAELVAEAEASDTKGAHR